MLKCLLFKKKKKTNSYWLCHPCVLVRRLFIVSRVNLSLVNIGTKSFKNSEGYWQRGDFLFLPKVINWTASVYSYNHNVMNVEILFEELISFLKLNDIETRAQATQHLIVFINIIYRVTINEP